GDLDRSRLTSAPRRLKAEADAAGAEADPRERQGSQEVAMPLAADGPDAGDLPVIIDGAGLLQLPAGARRDQAVQVLHQTSAVHESVHHSRCRSFGTADHHAPGVDPVALAVQAAQSAQIVLATRVQQEGPARTIDGTPPPAHVPPLVIVPARNAARDQRARSVSAS